MSWVIVKTFLSFGLILFLMAVLFYALKKFYPNFSGSSQQGLIMRIYGKLQIQPRKSIYIVRVLNKVLVLGVSENSISVLSELNEPEMIRVLDEIYSSGVKKNGKFIISKKGGAV